MLLIANDGPLPPEYLDHPLSGQLSVYRECHVGGDLLLMYRLEDGGRVSRSGYYALRRAKPNTKTLQEQTPPPRRAPRQRLLLAARATAADV